MLLFKQNKWTKIDIFTHIFRTILESQLDKGSGPLDVKLLTCKQLRFEIP